jgi:hypothetical protein
MGRLPRFEHCGNHVAPVLDRQRLTRVAAAAILVDVRRVSHLVAVFVLGLATAPGNLAMCAGWKPTPEARLACCARDGMCPMRAHGAATAASHHTITQASADSCCAAADRDGATPSSAYVLAGPVATPTAALPAFDLGPHWRAPLRAFESPPPARAVARHLLLSVILI